MKNSVIALLILFSSVLCSAQKVAISLPQANLTFVGISTRIVAVMENAPCERIYLKTDNGKIISQGDECEFYLNPERPGHAIIFIYMLNDLDTILVDTQKIRVQLIRDECLVPYINNSKGGSINKGVLLSGCVRVLLECFDINLEYSIASFHVQIVSKNEESNNFQNEGGCYNRNLKLAFEKLVSGDSVKISDIIIWSSFSNQRSINGIMNLIIE